MDHDPKPQKQRKTAERKERRPPKKPSPTYFENVSVYYLQRFSATTGSLRAVLSRRLKKAAPHHPDLDIDAANGWIDATVAKMVALGYVNDATYQESKIGSLRRKGASKRKIEAKLAEKGLKVTLPTDDEAELEAARAHVRRRRLGSYRTREVENARDKDLSSLARAGFSRSVALQALDDDQ